MAKTAAFSADDLLEQLWDSKGTDLLITPGIAPMIRVDGDLTRLEGYGPITGDDSDRLLRELANKAQAAVFDQGREVDFSFTWRKQARLRGNAFRTKGNVFRLLA